LQLPIVSIRVYARIKREVVKEIDKEEISETLQIVDVVFRNLWIVFDLITLYTFI
jgi:hypothetical protein